MKKFLITLASVAVLLLGLSGCSFTRYYDMYFYNEYPLSVTTWGAIDIDVPGDAGVYMPAENQRWVSPFYEKGPAEIPEDIRFIVAFKLYGYTDQFESDGWWFADRNCTFQLYYDGSATMYERSAFIEAVDNGEIYIIDNDGNKHTVRRVENPKVELN